VETWTRLRNVIGRLIQACPEDKTIDRHLPQPSEQKASVLPEAQLDKETIARAEWEVYILLETDKSWCLAFLHLFSIFVKYRL